MNRIAATFGGILCVGVAYAATLDASLIQTSGQPSVGGGKFYGYRTAAEGPGNNAFSNAYEKAVSECVPLVVVWSNEGCPHCDDFVNWLNGNKATVTGWLASKKAVFAFFKDNVSNSEYINWYWKVHGQPNRKIASHSPKACMDAWMFAAGKCGAEYSWPLFAFYYRKSDGTEVVWGTPQDDSGSTRTWAKFTEWYTDWLEENGIDPDYRGGTFEATGGLFDRYEAEPSTEYVDVELVRDSDKAGYACTNRVDAVWPGETEARWATNVEWTVGMASCTVRVPLSGGFKPGEISLRLCTPAGGVCEATPIVCKTEFENSAENPLYIGERDEDTLAYGEWTCDLRVATNKTARARANGTNAWTIVYSVGTQWCPYCYRNNQSFTGTETFKEWAASNHIVLVSADMPHNSDSNPNVDYGTIWNRKADRTNLYFDGLGPQYRSGKGYLSRKMVSEDAAREMREWLHEIGTGYLHLPEDYQASRAIIPGLSLIGADGRVAGRMETFDYDMNTATDGSKAALFCRRLEEMIAAEMNGAPDMASENLNDNCVTTPLTLPLFATAGETSAATGTISHADYRDVYRLTGFAPGVTARFVCKGTRAAQTRLCLLKGTADGEIAEMVLTATNILSETITIDTSAIDGFSFETNATYFVRVAAHSIMPTTSGNYRPYRLRWGDGDDGFSRDYAADYEGCTLTEYEISAEAICHPREAKSTVAVPAGGVVTMPVEEGELYRIAGIDTEKLPPSLVAADADGLYRAVASEDAVLAVASGSNAIEYQLWHPGEAVFVKDSQIAYTHMGDATLTVMRTGGVSGAKSGVVRLLEADVYSEGRYVWTNDVEVIWQDGEDGEKTVTLEIAPPGDIMHSMGTLVFGVDGSRLAVTLLDTDSPGLELLDYDAQTYRYFSSGISFGTVNMLSGNHVSVRVLSGSIPQGTRLAYDEESGKVELLGEPASEGDYEFAVALAEIRDGRYVVGPASTVRVKVDPTDEINPYLTKARSSETLPLYMDRGGTNIIAGTLSIAITSHGRISARYVGTEARTAAFSGAWQELDDENTAYARLVKGDCILDLALDADGVLYAELEVPPEYSCFAGAEDLFLTAEAAWPQEDPLDKYAGIYNVALPVHSCSRPDDAPSGTGILTLRMSPGTAARAGRFTYSGFMPDGTPLNGSVTAARAVEYGREFIRLPIFRRVGRNIFSATLTIDPYAALKWDSPDDPLAREAVRLAEGTMALSVHRDAAWEYEAVHNIAVGSYYLPGVSPLELSEMFYTNLYERPIVHVLRFDTAGLESPAFGSLSVPEADIVPSGDTMSPASPIKGLTFAFKSRTGMFSGSAVVTFTDESGKKKKVTGSYRGVLTPGWVRNCDCGDMVPEWYFGSGFLRYRDFNVEGRPVMKSLPVVLDPDSE